MVVALGGGSGALGFPGIGLRLGGSTHYLLSIVKNVLVLEIIFGKWSPVLAICFI